MSTFEGFLFILNGSLVFMIPLLIVALGAMFAEKSGVINIAMEGTMVFGAFCGVVFLRAMQENGVATASNSTWFYLISGIIAMVSGAAFSLLLGFSAINMKSDQTIAGTALNMFGPALTIFIAMQSRSVRNVQFSSANLFFSTIVDGVRVNKVPFLGDIPVLGPLLFQNISIMTIVGFIVWGFAYFIIKKTRFGLRLSACGENPQATDSVGINVYKYRYLGTMISGALGGLGGLIFIAESSVSWQGDVYGYGFLAIAVLIFGQWKPAKILWASLFFGIAKSLSARYSVFPIFEGVQIKWFFDMLPYLATMVVLVFTSKKSRAPKAEGIPYDKGAR